MARSRAVGPTGRSPLRFRLLLADVCGYTALTMQPRSNGTSRLEASDLTVALQASLPLEFRAYRDAFAFGAVIAILVFRPQGLIVARTARTRV